MATFEKDLEQIQNAIYGEEVREAIIEALEHCYDAESQFNAAYNQAITQFQNQLAAAISGSAEQAAAQASTAAIAEVNSAKTSAVSAVNTARDQAIQQIQSGLDPTKVGIYYSATAPSSPKNGTIWLKPVEE